MNMFFPINVFSVFRVTIGVTGLVYFVFILKRNRKFGGLCSLRLNIGKHCYKENTDAEYIFHVILIFRHTDSKNHQPKTSTIPNFIKPPYFFGMNLCIGRSKVTHGCPPVYIYHLNLISAFDIRCSIFKMSNTEYRTPNVEICRRAALAINRLLFLFQLFG